MNAETIYIYDRQISIQPLKLWDTHLEAH